MMKFVTRNEMLGTVMFYIRSYSASLEYYRTHYDEEGVERVSQKLIAARNIYDDLTRLDVKESSDE